MLRHGIARYNTDAPVPSGKDDILGGVGRKRAVRVVMAVMGVLLLLPLLRQLLWLLMVMMLLVRMHQASLRTGCHETRFRLIKGRRGRRRGRVVVVPSVAVDTAGTAVTASNSSADAAHGGVRCGCVRRRRRHRLRRLYSKGELHDVVVQAHKDDQMLGTYDLYSCVQCQTWNDVSQQSTGLAMSVTTYSLSPPG